MIGEVVVVFDRREGGGFAEEAEVVDGDGVWEDGLEGLGAGRGISKIVREWGS